MRSAGDRVFNTPELLLLIYKHLDWYDRYKMSELNMTSLAHLNSYFNQIYRTDLLTNAEVKNITIRLDRHSFMQLLIVDVRGSSVDEQTLSKLTKRCPRLLCLGFNITESPGGTSRKLRRNRDILYKSFSQNNNLKRVLVESNPESSFSDVDLIRMCSNLVSCCMLKLPKTVITDAGIKRALLTWRQLDTLDVSHCKLLSDVGISLILGHCKNLSVLDLSFTNTMGLVACLDVIQFGNSLRSLKVFYTKLSIEGAAILTDMENSIAYDFSLEYYGPLQPEIMDGSDEFLRMNEEVDVHISNTGVESLEEIHSLTEDSNIVDAISNDNPVYNEISEDQNVPCMLTYTDTHTTATDLVISKTETGSKKGYHKQPDQKKIQLGGWTYAMHCNPNDTNFHYTGNFSKIEHVFSKKEDITKAEVLLSDIMERLHYLFKNVQYSEFC